MNPFISLSHKRNGREYLADNCSINKVTVAKLPFVDSRDDIEGKTAMELFSTYVFIEEIKKRYYELNIDTENSNMEEKDYPKYLGECLNSENESIRITAEEIATLMGKRLGYILLTLKIGMKENQIIRKDWAIENWDYWANIRRIVLVGGLASGTLGNYMKNEMEKVFVRAGILPYETVLCEDSSNIGIMGCTTQINELDGCFPVFDFGQTNIKRSIVEKKNGMIFKITNLPNENSKYMNLDLKGERCKQEAKELHKYLLDIMKKTYALLPEWGTSLIISIANYTFDGQLNSVRGGYAKLTSLYSNYEDCLQEEISNFLQKKINVKLIHDGTAVALNFRECKETACITIGTAFGVGFPEIKI